MEVRVWGFVLAEVFVAFVAELELGEGRVMVRMLELAQSYLNEQADKKGDS